MLENLPEPAYPYKVFDRIEDPGTNFWWVYVQYREITPEYSKKLYEEAIHDPEGYLQKGKEQIKWAYERMKALRDEILSKDLTLERFMLGVYYMTTTYMWADREIIIDGYPGEYALEYYAKSEDELKLLEKIKNELNYEKVDEIWFEIQDFFFENLPNTNLAPVKQKYIQEVKEYIAYTPSYEGDEYKKAWHHYINGPFFKLPYLAPGTGRLKNPEILPVKTLKWKESPIKKYKGLSPGIAVGQIIYHVGSIEDVEQKIKSVEHPILFAIHTQPRDTPLFYKVKAVITTEGGLLSHTGIVAREAGIPAVSGIPFMSIPEYAWVIVDGTNGTVKQITEEEARKLLRHCKDRG